MVRLEHIGIAVKDLKEVEDLYKRLFGRESYKREEVVSEQVTTSFFDVGNTKVEFLQAGAENSAISKFIQKRGEGIHHIAFEVEDIHEEMERLQAEGFELINDLPKEGADNKLICFIHPKSTNGVLVELCQEIKKQ